MGGGGPNFSHTSQLGETLVIVSLLRGEEVGCRPIQGRPVGTEVEVIVVRDCGGHCGLDGQCSVVAS